MDEHHYRIDTGRWTLSRRSNRPGIELEPDPLMFELPDTIKTAERGHEVIDRAALFRQLLLSGEVRNRAELARRFGISRARVTQILGATKKTGER